MKVKVLIKIKNYIIFVEDLGNHAFAFDQNDYPPNYIILFNVLKFLFNKLSFKASFLESRIFSIRLAKQHVLGFKLKT